MGSKRRLFVALYTASGCAGLVYEVAWTRLLTLQLGHTVAAASTVLAAFMGGLALGATAAGARPARGGVSDLRAYAWLELAVAACALLLPFALAAAEPALGWAYADGTAPLRFDLVRVALCLALVGVPAAAMGATYPIAARWFGDAGLIYAVNTAGAAAGALAAGFWLIPALGLRATTWVGVGLNLVAAGGALWLAKRAPAAAAEPDARKSSGKAPARAQGAPGATVTPMPRLAYAAAAVSGLAALAYEVVWTRLLALVIGPTTYAFATMLAAFIAGLAIGSAAGVRIARHARRPAVWLAAALISGGVFANAAAWYAATRMPLAVAVQVAAATAQFREVALSQGLSVAVLLLPMTFALGAAFPLALATAGAQTSPARAAARVYAANTLGAIGGALAAGFVLVPWLGLRLTIREAGLLATLTGVACLVAAVRGEGRAPETRQARKRQGDVSGRGGRFAPGRLASAAGLGGVAAAALILSLPPWDHALLASGAYKYAPYLAGTDLASVLRAGRLEYYREGASGTVSVRLLAGTRSLAIDGKVDASNAGDMLTQRLLGLLPVLIHGEARDVCIIGLGSGVSVGAALAPGTVRSTDVVEISPEVVEASRLFDADSGAALTRAGVRLIVGDGRSHLLLTPRRYDVIVSEPSNPWMAGVATLFTREFFEAARSRLKPDGVICQWAHTYDIGADDLKSIVRSFGSVFPQGTLWLVGDGDLLLIGTNGGAITPRLAAIASGAGRGDTPGALRGLGVAEGTAPFALLSLYAGGPDELARYAGDARIQTDDHTPLEYSAPRALFGHTRGDNVTAIRALAPALPPPVRDAFARASDSEWTSRGVMLLKAQAFALAYEAFRQAVTLNSRNTEALSGLSDAAGGSGRLIEERDWLTSLAASEPTNAAVRIELSRVLAVGGDSEGARRAAEQALQLAPHDARASEQLAAVLADSGAGDALAELADAMIARFPERIEPRYYEATASYLRGRRDEALANARRVVEQRPDHARAQGLLGVICAALGERDCARTALDAAIRANPRNPAAYVSAGLFRLQVGEAAAATDHFASALAIDPRLAAARTGLARARELLQTR